MFKFEEKQLFNRPILIYLLGLILLIILLVFMSEVLIRPTRGLDVTDESLYILSTATEKNWSYPFGWSTSWMFSLVGHNLAYFRTAGFVILELSSILLGYSIYKYSFEFSTNSFSHFRANLLTFLGLGAITPLFYYGGYHRTPSYNWSNLVCLNFGISLLLLILLQYRSFDHDNSTRSKQHLVVALFAASTIFFGVAKPSTSVGLYMIALILMARLGKRCIWVFFRRITIYSLLTLFLLVLIGPWEFDFVKVFLFSVSAPTHLAEQTVSGALADLFRSPGDFYSLGLDTLTNFAGGSGRLFILFALVASILILAKAYSGKFISKFGDMGLTLLCGAIMFDHFGWFRLIGQEDPASRWVSADPVRTAILSLLLLLMLRPIRSVLRPVKTRVDKNLTDWLVVPGLLCFATLAFGFGSGHAIYRQISLAPGFLLFISHREVAFRSRYRFPVQTLLIPLICVSGALITIRESYLRPFRSASINSAVSELDLGIYGGKIYVEAGLAEFVNDFRGAAALNGYISGDPVVALTWRWKAFPVLMLEAEPPQSIMLTHDFRVDILEHHLTRDENVLFLQKSWLLVSPASVIPESEISNITQIYDAIAEKTGLLFPRDYDCVVKSPILELWSPKQSGSITNSLECSTYIQSGGEYDFHQGYIQ